MGVSVGIVSVVVECECCAAFVESGVTGLCEARRRTLAALLCETCSATGTQVTVMSVNISRKIITGKFRGVTHTEASEQTKGLLFDH